MSRLKITNDVTRDNYIIARHCDTSFLFLSLRVVRLFPAAFVREFVGVACRRKFGQIFRMAHNTPCLVIPAETNGARVRLCTIRAFFLLWTRIACCCIIVRAWRSLKRTRQIFKKNPCFRFERSTRDPGNQRNKNHVSWYRNTRWICCSYCSLSPSFSKFTTPCFLPEWKEKKGEGSRKREENNVDVDKRQKQNEKERILVWR